MKTKFKINCCPGEFFTTDSHSKHARPILLYDSKTDTLCIYCPECGRSQVAIKDEAIKNWNYETHIVNPYVLTLEADVAEDTGVVNILTTPKNGWTDCQMSTCALCKSTPKFEFDTSNILNASSVEITAVCPKCGLIAGHFVAELTRAIELSEGIVQVTDTWNSLQKLLNSVKIERKDDI